MHTRVFLCLLLCLFLESPPLLAQKLMPMPSQISVQGEGFYIPDDFTVSLSLENSEALEKYALRFVDRLGTFTGRLQFPQEVLYQGEGASLHISIEQVAAVQLGVDESYVLEVSPHGVNLTAATDIGAMRGLETLLQLVDHDQGGAFFRGVKIEDRPRFAWRGLLLDVSRHFMPVQVVKRTLDGMAAVKMNVLHWHLCDDHGWRVELKNSPELHQNASEGEYYTQEQIREIVAYATARGIRVMPEVDVPGHASAILTAYPELGSMEMEYHLQRTAGVFDPTLDPTNPQTYERLQLIFEEMATLFPDPYFHIGGDENEGKHWAANEDIQAFMKEKGLEDQHALQAYFNIELQKLMDPLGKKLMGWDEILDGDLPTTAIIQAWRGWIAEPNQLPHARAARKGHQVVVSMGYYLDLLYPAASHYAADPMPVDGALTEEEQQNILGGEACMWAELITPETIDSRLWPRTAAVAERFWSPVSVTDPASMYERLPAITRQLEAVGIQPFSARDQYIRRWAASSMEEDILKALIAICEPLKGYTRNTNGNLYTMQSPFTLFADACSADAPTARLYNWHIGVLLSGEGNTEESIAWLTTQLAEWGRLIQNTGESPELFMRMAEGEGLNHYYAELQTIARLTEPLLQALIDDKEVDEKVLTEANAFVMTGTSAPARVEDMLFEGFQQLVKAFENR